MEEHKLTVSRTARYYTMGKPGPHIKYWVIACHGYGQLGKHFIRKFDAIQREDTFVLAPEGLSRFYWGGLSGQPAASWMTSEGRLEEIADYTAYLSSLHERYLGQFSGAAKLVLLGFSQGATTLVRWLHAARPAFSDLVLWAGTAPEDITYQGLEAYLSGRQVHSVCGDEDPYLTPSRMEAQLRLLKGWPAILHERGFTGGHTVDRAALKALFDEIRKEGEN
ncbi:alpha/beta hydrolase [Phaeodactylibacter luteus]|uniref:Phospholipase n=1 Tax=Phaeodactylibacter luteus TaxID=1564516 RepID=A0A5C6RIN6_9BACT|nr:phospholipase [Phaeodactylibacter luteus]TXB61829.1 phospholipase [Phaeodactylibacter luteus]